jgi:dynein heavy chain, axonemal
VHLQEKVRDADAFAAKVGAEKVKVNAENAAANIEKEKCEQIAVEVTEKQASCEKDLAAALPLVEQVCTSCDAPELATASCTRLLLPLQALRLELEL